MVLIRKKIKKSPEELEADRQEKERKKAGIQDEFQAKGFELATWAQDHKMRITIGLLVLTTVISLWVGFSQFSQGSMLKANADYEVALKLMERASNAKSDSDQQLKKALKAFEEVSEKYSGSKLARLADLFMGDIALKTKDAKVALSAFERAMNASPKKDPLRVIAMLGIVNAREASSDAKGAFEMVESILMEGINIDEPMLLWQAQRLAKEVGEDKKSAEFALQLIDRFPTSAYANQVQVASSKSE